MSFPLTFLIPPNSIHPTGLNSDVHSFQKPILAPPSYTQTLWLPLFCMIWHSSISTDTAPHSTFLFTYLSPSLDYFSIQFQSKVFRTWDTHNKHIWKKRKDLYKYFTNLLSSHYSIWYSEWNYEVDSFVSILQIGKLSLR